MRFLALVFLLMFPFSWGNGQHEVKAEVAFYRGNGGITYVFSPEGNLLRSSQTGGPTWRKDTVVSVVYNSGPDYTYRSINLHRSNGQRRLLAEQTMRKSGQTLRVEVTCRDPNLGLRNATARYELNEQGLVVTALIKYEETDAVPSVEKTGFYTYDYLASGRCVVTDTLSKQVVAEVLLRKKHTLVRMMEQRNKGYEFTFDLHGLLKSIVYRDGAAGHQTDYYSGKKGLQLGATSFSLSILGGPAPKARWRSNTVNGGKLVQGTRQKIAREILEGLAFTNTDYRLFFPRGYAPAEAMRR